MPAVSQETFLQTSYSLVDFPYLSQPLRPPSIEYVHYEVVHSLPYDRADVVSPFSSVTELRSYSDESYTTSEWSSEEVSSECSSTDDGSSSCQYGQTVKTELEVIWFPALPDESMSERAISEMQANTHASSDATKQGEVQVV